MKALILTMGVALSTSPLLAKAQDLGAMQRCRALNEAAARLSCYDAIKLPAVAGKTAVAVPVATALPVIAPVIANVAAPLVPVTATAAVAVAAAPEAVAAPATASPAAQFGLEGKAPAAALGQIESQLLGDFEGWESRTIFRLANGQAWQVDDDSNASYALRSPKVTIRRGMFGAFYLEVDGAKRSPRVKRLR